MPFLQSLCAVLVLGASAGPALAHLGHVGELAGHAHWVGIGLAGAAALAAGLLAKNRKREQEAESADLEADEESGEPAGEQA